MKYCAVKCASWEKISIAENGWRLKKSFSIDFLDPIVCFIFSGTSPSNGSQDLIGKLLQRIHDSSSVENLAQFRCIDFRREVVIAFASWIRWAFYPVVSKWGRIANSGIGVEVCILKHRRYRGSKNPFDGCELGRSWVCFKFIDYNSCTIGWSFFWYMSFDHNSSTHRIIPLPKELSLHIHL
jgi:hypothetical protein